MPAPKCGCERNHAENGKYAREDHHAKLPTLGERGVGLFLAASIGAERGRRDSTMPEQRMDRRERRVAGRRLRCEPSSVTTEWVRVSPVVMQVVRALEVVATWFAPRPPRRTGARNSVDETRDGAPGGGRALAFQATRAAQSPVGRLQGVPVACLHQRQPVVAQAGVWSRPEAAPRI